MDKKNYLILAIAAIIGTIAAQNAIRSLLTIFLFINKV
jgi:hypothetical protein